MTAAEALAQAEAEGLTLARSDNPSGFRNTPEGRASTAALPPTMTAAEALAQAQTERLTLDHSSTNQSGFRNVAAVSVEARDGKRPYKASVLRDGKNINLGCFATAEEAALHVARIPEGRATAALPPPMTAAE
eukprot:5825724-Prymnesium_polylepis.1